MGGKRQEPRISHIMPNDSLDGGEENIYKIKDILTTMMAEYVIAKSQGKI